MWDQIISVAISNGIFAMLFVALLLYTLKDSSSREKKYQNTISTLSKNLGVVEDIQNDVTIIKNVVVYSKEKSNERKTKTKSQEL